MKAKYVLGTFIFMSWAVILLSALGYYLLKQREYRTPGEYFDSNGVQIYYTKEGEGVPVILVHGFAYNSDLEWRQTGVYDALLNEGYQVITIDCRGNGLSAKPHERIAYGVEMPNDIIRLMDYLKIEKAHVVGYSMGGYITLKLLEMHPERLLSAVPGGMTWHPTSEADYAFVNKLATSLEKEGDFSPLFERLNLPIPSGIGMQIVGWLARRGNDTKALAAIMWEFPKFEVKEDSLRNNAIATLTIVGDADPLSEHRENMHSIMKNHELAVIPGRDHTNTTHDEKFLEALLPFLRLHSSVQNVDSEGTELQEAA